MVSSLPPSLGYGFQVRHPRTKRKISTSLFMTVDRMAIDPTVNRTVFFPTMEAIATTPGVEVAEALASTVQENSATEPSK